MKINDKTLVNFDTICFVEKVCDDEKSKIIFHHSSGRSETNEMTEDNAAGLFEYVQKLLNERRKIVKARDGRIFELEAL